MVSSPRENFSANRLTNLPGSSSAPPTSVYAMSSDNSSRTAPARLGDDVDLFGNPQEFPRCHRPRNPSATQHWLSSPPSSPAPPRSPVPTTPPRSPLPR